MPIRVLVADDNSDVRQVLQSELEQHPLLEVCGVTWNGADTIDKALALKPDIVVLDFSLPDRNGLQVAAALKRKLPETKIILFTLFDDLFGDSVAAASGVYAVVSKEEGLAPLLAIIQELLTKLDASPAAVPSLTTKT